MAAVTEHTAVVTLPGDTQILITREFDAPARLVWKAYTTPELIKRWWSGERGTVTSADVDLRVGGAWRYEMTANGGFDVVFYGEYREIVEHERIVATEIFAAFPDNVSVVTHTFAEADGRTTLTMLCDYDSRETRDTVIATGMEDGMQESMNSLEKVAVSLAA